MTTTISVREVSDVTYRVLRATGTSSGCAMRAAAMVQHAEVYHGIGLQMLHRQLDLITGDTAPSGLDVLHGPESALFLDALGGTALVAGPPAMDLACAEAMEHGFGVVWMQHARGLSLLEELVYRAAAYEDLVCVLSWAMSNSDDEPLGESRTVISGPGPGGPIVAEHALSGPSVLAAAAAGLLEKGEPDAKGNGEDLIAELLSTEGEEGARKLIESSLSENEAEENTLVPGAVLICVRVQDAAEAWLEPLLWQAVEQANHHDVRIRTRADLDRTWEEACASGVELDSETWSELYEAAGRMLVSEPTIARREKH